MRVITEARLREELGKEWPKIYRIPEGTILTPAARELLWQRKIRPVSEKEEEEAAGSKAARAKTYISDGKKAEGAKPEEMTSLRGNELVDKAHPVICFRGSLDSLQALILLTQTMLMQEHEKKPSRAETLMGELEELLIFLRQMMRAEVMEEPLRFHTLLGLTSEELREHSHDPRRYYGVEPMKPPSAEWGQTYAMLNLLRTAVRDTERAAVQAFCGQEGCGRKDIIEGLNRASSALHILMCRYQAGWYDG